MVCAPQSNAGCYLAPASDAWGEVFAHTLPCGCSWPGGAGVRVQRLLAQVYAHRLAEIRKRWGMTQTDVAREMGVSQRCVSAIEHGAEQATRATLAAYLAAFGGRLRLIAEFEDESLALG